MRVVMISDQETFGGAAVAASRLATTLIERGHEIVRIVPERDGRAHPWKTVELRLTVFLRIVRRVAPRAIWREVSERVAALRLGKMLGALQPDVLNIHNLHGAPGADWSPEFAAVCAKIAPTVWTLHDMWSFSGRCAYSGECRRFADGCGSDCPTPSEYPALEPRRIAGAWRHRRRVLQNSARIVAVTPSRWLAGEAVTGPWPPQAVDTIPYGIPLDVFAPVDRAIAREALAVDSNGPVLLMVAVDWGDRRKGAHVLMDALARLPKRPTVIALGSAENRTAEHWAGAKLHRLGFIDHERTRALVYNAADALVHPALQDNLPNVVLESMACGTPIVGLPVGGVPEMVRTGRTGWLADQPEAEPLAVAIDRALREIAGGFDLRKPCREVAEDEYSVDLQAERYERLFLRLLGGCAEEDVVSDPTGRS